MKLNYQILFKKLLFITIFLIVLNIVNAECPFNNYDNLSNFIYNLNSSIICSDIHLNFLNNIIFNCNNASFNTTTEEDFIFTLFNANNITFNDCNIETKHNYNETPTAIMIYNSSNIYLNNINIPFGYLRIGSNTQNFESISIDNSYFTDIAINSMGDYDYYPLNINCEFNSFKDNIIINAFEMFNCYMFGNENFLIRNEARIFNANLFNETDLIIPVIILRNDDYNTLFNVTLYDLYFNSNNISLRISDNSNPIFNLIYLTYDIFNYTGNQEFREYNKTINFYMDDNLINTYYNVFSINFSTSFNGSSSDLFVFEEINITEENNTYPIIEQYLPDIDLNLAFNNCFSLKWNVTDDDNLTYLSNNNIINISNNGLITGCYNNSSINLYYIIINATDIINQNVSDYFYLNIYYLDDFNINEPIITYEEINLYNATITFTFDEIANLSFEINNITYSGSNNNIYTFYILPLNENIIYTYNIFAKDNYNNNITMQEQFKTKGYEDIQLEIQLKTYNLTLMFMILFILFALYIISEIFQLIPIGILSGVGLIVYSLSLFAFIDLWLFLTLIFSGLFILIRFLIGYFTS